MQYIDEELTKIMNEYDEDRAIARIKREKMIKSVHEKLPEVEKIENEINRLGIENFGNILKNPQKSAEYNEEFEKKISELKNKKDDILEKNGIPKDYSEIKYKCEKCLDTGYIDREKCSCFKQKLIKMRYNMSNIGSNLHDFDEFSFDYYSDKIIPGLEVSEKENMKYIYQKTYEFTENDGEKSLFFYGGCGLGKTFLSSCAAKKMMDEGKTVIYSTSTNIFSEYEDYKFGKKDINEYNKLREMLYNADLLIIDDLGVEVSNPMSMQFFFDLTEKRISENKRMIINTNLSLDGIKKRYTERFISRLYEYFRIMKFFGEDIRKIKLSTGNLQSKERKKNG